jgi:hypothetical protein
VITLRLSRVFDAWTRDWLEPLLATPPKPVSVVYSLNDTGKSSYARWLVETQPLKRDRTRFLLWDAACAPRKASAAYVWAEWREACVGSETERPVLLIDHWDDALAVGDQPERAGLSAALSELIVSTAPQGTAPPGVGPLPPAIRVVLLTRVPGRRVLLPLARRAAGNSARRLSGDIDRLTWPSRMPLIPPALLADAVVDLGLLARADAQRLVEDTGGWLGLTAAGLELAAAAEPRPRWDDALLQRLSSRFVPEVLEKALQYLRLIFRDAHAAGDVPDAVVWGRLLTSLERPTDAFEEYGLPLDPRGGALAACLRGAYKRSYIAVDWENVRLRYKKSGIDLRDPEQATVRDGLAEMLARLASAQSVSPGDVVLFGRTEKLVRSTLAVRPEWRIVLPPVSAPGEADDKTLIFHLGRHLNGTPGNRVIVVSGDYGYFDCVQSDDADCLTLWAPWAVSWALRDRPPAGWKVRHLLLERWPDLKLPYPRRQGKN